MKEGQSGRTYDNENVLAKEATGQRIVACTLWCVEPLGSNHLKPNLTLGSRPIGVGLVACQVFVKTQTNGLDGNIDQLVFTDVALEESAKDSCREEAPAADGYNEIGAEGATDLSRGAGNVLVDVLVGRTVVVVWKLGVVRHDS